MSQFSEISNLRKAGKLQEALEAAQNWLAVDTDNFWAKRALSWVYYGFLKQYVEADNFGEVCTQVDAIIELDLPKGEDMLFESLAYSLGKFFFQVSRNGSPDGAEIYALFGKIKSLPFPKPSKSYSFLLKSLHKGLKDSLHYKELIEWWGLRNFLAEDFDKAEVNGRKIMCLAEQVLIRYSKQLLPSKADIHFGQEVNVEAIRDFIPFLNAIVSKYPSLTFLPYFEAKLMIAAGDGEDALKAILPFARQKQNEYWVWQVLAESYPGNPEYQIACYARALTCNAKEEFLVNIRMELAELLIREEMCAEAKSEVEKSCEIRTLNGWKIPSKMSVWQKADWYQQTESGTDNSDFYSKYLSLADEILYQDMPFQTGVINFVNPAKRIAGFVVSKSVSGAFQWDLLGEKPEIGQSIELRLLERNGESGKWFKVLSVKNSNRTPEGGLIKEFSGKFYKRANWVFGLVDEVFIPPSVVEENGLNSDDLVCGKAILSFDRKKGQWGFSAFEVKGPNLSEIDIAKLGPQSDYY